MPSKSSHLATHHEGVKEVRTDELFPNPHNPRVLFDKLPMGDLLDSIRRMGILVPLTIYRDNIRKRYIILDGQRRWMCAKDAGIPKVPVNQVAEPTLVQNIVTMFQIHKLREDWELMPTALKVQLLMSEIGDKSESRLAALTGLDESVIVRCKKLVSYDSEFKDMMLDPDPECRVKADFFIELYPVIHDRDVSRFDWFKQKPFIGQMLVKYLEAPKTIKAVTDFRLIKQHITNARRIKAIGRMSGRLKKFAEDPATPVDSLEIEGANIHAQANALVKKITTIEALVTELDSEQFYGEEDLWQAMTRLIRVMEDKLRKADKRR